VADSDDQESVADYITQRQLIAERFIALGGGTTVEMELRKMPKLKDLVTDQHRDMVKDLTAGGMSHDGIARVMGISKERLQSLFDYELAVGFELAESTLARAMYLKGVAGESSAATNWLRYHKKSQWSDKKEMTDKGAQQETDAAVTASKAANDDFLAKLLAGIAVDEKMVRPVTPKAQPKQVEPAKVVAPKKPTQGTVKRAKGD
jgi:hypothetical protein